MISFPLERLDAPLSSFGLTLDATAKNRLQTYGNLLLEWNARVNLTAITDPQEVVEKHFLDCLLLLRHDEPPARAAVIDVGTGAGFPGLVLLIARPDLRLTLLDSLQKRVRFLRETVDALGLTAETVHARAEDAGRDPAFRERFDRATARAVAKLPTLCEYCLPFVRVGGRFFALKGPGAQAEAETSLSAARLLGGGKPVCFDDRLPGGDERCFVCCEKRSQTPTKYPRPAAKIAKQPL